MTGTARWTALACILAAVALSGCVTPEGAGQTFVGAETLTQIHGKAYESWHCENGVELHKPSGRSFGEGFVRIDGATLPTTYSRDGLQHVWYWGKYQVVQGLSGYARYYDFTGIPEGQRIKPAGVLKCSR